MPDCFSLVVLHVLLVIAEICSSSASMLALMLDADACGAVVMMMLSFLLKRAALAAATAAGTLVNDGQDGQFFWPTLKTVLKMGVGVGLLAWL